MAARVYISPESRHHALVSQLAAELALSALPVDYDGDGLLLEYRHGRLQVRKLGVRERPWYVDFNSARSSYRRTSGGGTKQALARAVGIKGSERPSVVDATAGWGRDAFVLASLGCNVAMLERNPLVAALLADGLRRGAQTPDIAQIVARMYLHTCDACDHLRALAADAASDVAYLDPMYPLQGKSAAVKKDLRLLRELLGDPVTEPQLLEAALASARVRVVVKRPKSAPPLTDRSPDATVASANTRYDVYFTNP